MRNVLLTGLPRSGTTLVCHLLNKLPDTVALHEPLNPHLLMAPDRLDVCQKISLFCDKQRDQIRSSGTAVSKAMDGQVPSNPMADDVVGGQRLRQINGNEILVTNVRSYEFSIYVKHPAFFTGYLPGLIDSFECFAIVRNPLAVLLSWRDVPMPVAHGRAPSAELAAPALARALDHEPDVLCRQLILLDFFFERYVSFLQGRTLRYEDVILTDGRCLELIEPKARLLNAVLQSRNSRRLQTDPSVLHIADRLLQSDNACWNYYRRADVFSLLENNSLNPLQQSSIAD